MCVFAFSVFNIVRITKGYKDAAKLNAELQERYVNTDDSTEEDKQIPLLVDFDALKQQNGDIIGWIYCPATPINYPVVQGGDNSKYLRADLNGKYSSSGTIFSDYRNKNIGVEANYIIYGHNMKNSTMFGTLNKYKEQSYYDSHPIIYFLTPEENYIIEIFAGAVVKRDSEIYQTSPKEAIISDIIAKSTFNSTVTIKGDENIITLSTCSYEFNNARYVLLGKLIKV